MNMPTEPTLAREMDSREAAPASPGATRETRLPLRLPAAIRFSIIGIFIILLVGAVHFAKEILLPVALAFMLTLTLSPVVRFFARFRIPEVVSSLAIVLALLGSAVTGVIYLSGPVSGWIDGAPQTEWQIRRKLASMRGPVDAAVNASKKVEEITSGTSDPQVQKVVVQQPGLISRLADGALAVVSIAGVTLVLMFFLLASGRLFYEKLVRVLPTLTEKKRAIRVVNAVEEEVSVYLLTISVINVSLGVAIAGVMWTLGMPNPILWGVMAAGLNFIPYVGALIGVGVVAVVALVSFDSVGSAMVAPALYFACTTIEGQFVTPALLGKRLEMNAVAVFVSVAGWGWLWGVPGAMMAVPFLVSLRVMCDHFPELSAVGEFLSGRTMEDDDPSTDDTAPRGNGRGQTPGRRA